jgi:hypothetical protein
MTSTESFPLPHEQLTLIPGKLSAATIRQLKKELYANARSIHSDRGGGLNGHLGLVMPTAAYVIRAGAAALCYKADESADESKKWALVKRLKSEMKIG